jgi:serine protease Do
MKRIPLFFITSLMLSACITADPFQTTALPNEKMEKPCAVAPFDISKGFSSVAEKTMPAVVSIMTTQVIGGDDSAGGGGQMFGGVPQDFQDLFKRFFEQMERPRKVQAMGSGFIIKATAEHAYIVTNHHVIDQAKEIRVQLNDGTELLAENVGHDERTDIAVVKVSTKNIADKNKVFPTLEWGVSKDVRIGDWVVAIGNPFGLENSVTAGNVSSLGRSLAGGIRADYARFIQHSAPINRGNSGGPLTNLRGEVIGINTLIFSPSGGNIGIGFAVPSTTAKRVVEQLISMGRTKRGWIGVVIRPVDQRMLESLGISKDQMRGARGVIVNEITPKGPADKAGLKQGDILIEYDNQPVMDNITQLVGETNVDNKAILHFLRRDEKTGNLIEYRTEITVGEYEQALKDGKISSNPGEPKAPPADAKSETILEMKVQELSAQSKKAYEKELNESLDGVVIVDFDSLSSAAESGLQRGDIITEVNLNKIKNFTELKQQVESARRNGRKNIMLTFWRNKSFPKNYVTLPLNSDTKEEKLLKDEKRDVKSDAKNKKAPQGGKGEK